METTGKDICYNCNSVQEYGTMKDIDENDFSIFCDDCYPKIKKIVDEVIRIDEAIESHREDISRGSSSFYKTGKIMELQALAGQKEKHLKTLGYNN